MNKYIAFIASVVAALSLNAQKKDTVRIDASNLIAKNLNFGNAAYIVYHKAGKNKPMQNATLVKINTQKVKTDGKNTISIHQVWEADTIIHTAETLLEEGSLKTLKHASWWKRKGYTENFDFLKGEASFSGKISDDAKSKITTSFNNARSGNFVNWHSDLIFFPLLPFKENTVFKINFYEPGIDVPKEEIYEVLKSEKIKFAGNSIDCWVLNYKVAKPAGYQRFWISKNSNELIKEEDDFGHFYRLKLKLVPEQN